MPNAPGRAQKSPVSGPPAERAAAESEIVDRFHELYYAEYPRTVGDTYWLGVRTQKCPLDLWVYQEILADRRPGLIVETGTYLGGSALFLASVCDLIGSGRIITIDVRELPEGRPEHPRIEYRTGSSIVPELVNGVRESVEADERVMVILDSNHRKHHVLAELRAYSPLVTPGDYLIVEDTSVNGHPVLPDYGPGPMEAVDEFLASDDAFVADESREKFFMTFNPRGYLRRRQ
jgi:cephalosporin hydroxylase